MPSNRTCENLSKKCSSIVIIILVCCMFFVIFLKLSCKLEGNEIFKQDLKLDKLIKEHKIFDFLDVGKKPHSRFKRNPQARKVTTKLPAKYGKVVTKKPSYTTKKSKYFLKTTCITTRKPTYDSRSIKKPALVPKSRSIAWATTKKPQLKKIHSVNRGIYQPGEILNISKSEFVQKYDDPNENKNLQKIESKPKSELKKDPKDLKDYAIIETQPNKLDKIKPYPAIVPLKKPVSEQTLKSLNKLNANVKAKNLNKISEKPIVMDKYLTEKGYSKFGDNKFTKILPDKNAKIPDGIKNETPAEKPVEKPVEKPLTNPVVKPRITVPKVKNVENVKKPLPKEIKQNLKKIPVKPKEIKIENLQKDFQINEKEVKNFPNENQVENLTTINNENDNKGENFTNEIQMNVNQVTANEEKIEFDQKVENSTENLPQNGTFENSSNQGNQSVDEKFSKPIDIKKNFNLTGINILGNLTMDLEDNGNMDMQLDIFKKKPDLSNIKDSALIDKKGNTKLFNQKNFKIGNPKFENLGAKLSKNTKETIKETPKPSNQSKLNSGKYKMSVQLNNLNVETENTEKLYGNYIKDVEIKDKKPELENLKKDKYPELENLKKDKNPELENLKKDKNPELEKPKKDKNPELENLKKDKNCTTKPTKVKKTKINNDKNLEKDIPKLEEGNINKTQVLNEPNGLDIEKNSEKMMGKLTQNMDIKDKKPDFESQKSKLFNDKKEIQKEKQKILNSGAIFNDIMKNLNLNETNIESPNFSDEGNSKNSTKLNQNEQKFLNNEYLKPKDDVANSGQVFNKYWGNMKDVNMTTTETPNINAKQKFDENDFANLSKNLSKLTQSNSLLNMKNPKLNNFENAENFKTKLDKDLEKMDRKNFNSKMEAPPGFDSAEMEKNMEFSMKPQDITGQFMKKSKFSFDDDEESVPSKQKQKAIKTTTKPKTTTIKQKITTTKQKTTTISKTTPELATTMKFLNTKLTTTKPLTSSSIQTPDDYEDNLTTEKMQVVEKITTENLILSTKISTTEMPNDYDDEKSETTLGKFETTTVVSSTISDIYDEMDEDKLIAELNAKTTKYFRRSTTKLTTLSTTTTVKPTTIKLTTKYTPKPDTMSSTTGISTSTNSYKSNEEDYEDEKLIEAFTTKKFVPTTEKYEDYEDDKIETKGTTIISTTTSKKPEVKNPEFDDYSSKENTQNIVSSTTEKSINTITKPTDVKKNIVSTTTEKSINTITKPTDVKKNVVSITTEKTIKATVKHTEFKKISSLGLRANLNMDFGENLDIKKEISAKKSELPDIDSIISSTNKTNNNTGNSKMLLEQKLKNMDTNLMDKNIKFPDETKIKEPSMNGDKQIKNQFDSMTDSNKMFGNHNFDIPMDSKMSKFGNSLDFGENSDNLDMKNLNKNKFDMPNIDTKISKFNQFVEKSEKKSQKGPKVDIPDIDIDKKMSKFNQLAENTGQKSKNSLKNENFEMPNMDSQMSKFGNNLDFGENSEKNLKNNKFEIPNIDSKLSKFNQFVDKSEKKSQKAPKFDMPNIDTKMSKFNQLAENTGQKTKNNLKNENFEMPSMESPKNPNFDMQGIDGKMSKFNQLVENSEKKSKISNDNFEMPEIDSKMSNLGNNLNFGKNSDLNAKNKPKFDMPGMSSKITDFEDIEYKNSDKMEMPSTDIKMPKFKNDFEDQNFNMSAIDNKMSISGKKLFGGDKNEKSKKNCTKSGSIKNRYSDILDNFTMSNFDQKDIFEEKIREADTQVDHPVYKSEFDNLQEEMGGLGRSPRMDNSSNSNNFVYFNMKNNTGNKILARIQVDHSKGETKDVILVGDE